VANCPVFNYRKLDFSRQLISIIVSTYSAMNRTFYLLVAVFSFLLISVHPIFAQIDSSGFAHIVPIQGEVQNGDIICTYESGVAPCTSEYDSALFGVYVERPGVVVNDPDIENGKAVSKEGITYVRVTGPISQGDLVTTSETPGVGKKATTNGYVLGIALDSLNGSDTQRIQVLVNIHPATTLAGAQGNLIQFIRKGISVPIFQPLESLRYLLAVLIVIISFTLGLVYFGRASRTGIEAIGRNPLAKRVIQLTIILNIVLTLVIILVGLAIAYMILIL
jgi:hypothetical protein